MPVLEKFVSRLHRFCTTIQHPVSSIQHPVSSIQHPVSSIQYPASSIPYPASFELTKAFRTLSINTETAFAMEEQPLNMLIQKYLDGEATTEEKNLIEAWYDSFENAAPLFDDYDPQLPALLEEGFAALQARLGLKT